MNSFWPLVHYARPHWRGLLFVAGTMVLLVGLDVLRPWPTKVLVDHVLGHQPLAGGLEKLPASLQNTQGLLLAACLATVLIFAVRAAVGIASASASVTLGQRMVYDLAADTF